MTRELNNYWDEQAASFDAEPDHGLRDPVVRAAWRDLLMPLLPPPPARIADVGCGTASLSVLLAEAGYDVHGLDLSAQMLTAARIKLDAAGVHAPLARGDAARPPFAPGSCDVVLERHVLWAIDDQFGALRQWSRLLAPGGTLVLVEGTWGSGAGLDAAQCATLVRRVRRQAEIILLPDPALWGRAIDDQRYVLVSYD